MLWRLVFLPLHLGDSPCQPYLSDRRPRDRNGSKCSANVVTVRDFTPSFLDSVFQSAAASKRQHAGRGRGARVRWSPHWNALRDHVMISLFYEASTRTRHFLRGGDGEARRHGYHHRERGRILFRDQGRIARGLDPDRERPTAT